MASVDQPDWTLQATITAGRVTAQITNATIPISGAVSISSGTITIDGNVTVEQAPTAVFVGVGQLTSTTVPVQYTAPQLARTIFGTGPTGTVTISSNATLTGTKLPKNLTIAAGVTVKTGGYGVFVATVTTGGAGSVLTNSGTPGGVTHTHAAGVVGGVGGATGRYKGGATGGGVSSTTPSAGSNTPYQPTTTKPGSLLFMQGGAGGAGAAVGGHANKTANGGTAGLARALRPTGTQLRTAYLCGGAGGGGAWSSNNSSTSTYAQAAGGGGGGVVLLATRTLKGALVLRAKGGTGRGIRMTTGLHAIAIGGPGGGGAAVLLAHFSSTWTGHVTNAGGTVTVITGHNPPPAQRGTTKIQKIHGGVVR